MHRISVLVGTVRVSNGFQGNPADCAGQSKVHRKSPARWQARVVRDMPTGAAGYSCIADVQAAWRQKAVKHCGRPTEPLLMVIGPKGMSQELRGNPGVFESDLLLLWHIQSSLQQRVWPLHLIDAAPRA